MPGSEKSAGAFLTIGELAAETGLPQHKLRYWEQRFPQLRPLQRAGMRRYYRPEDVALVRRIHMLLDQQGYTILGVQKLLAAEATGATAAAADTSGASGHRAPLERLRDILVQALTEDARQAMPSHRSFAPTSTIKT